jgi:glycosyltransferase involved in cell wall biosynthesis
LLIKHPSVSPFKGRTLTLNHFLSQQSNSISTLKIKNQHINKMPKVLRIINRLNLGGPTYNAAYLTKYLAPEFETMLVAGTKDDSEESSEFIVESLGLDYVKLPEMHRELDFTNDRIAYKKLKQIIADFKPDIVHTHAAKAGALGRLAAHNTKVPVVLHTFHGHVFHSYFSPLKTKIFIEIEKYLAGKSSKIIAISEAQKNELANVYKICAADKIEVIPLGFDLSRFQENQDEKRIAFRKEYQIDEDEIAIGIIGRIVPIKNHKFFLKAIKKISTLTDKKIRAFIIGDGESRAEVEAMAANIDIDFTDYTTDKRKALLTFTSWIKEIDVANAGMDIITLTSLNEGTPVSLIEAQASNKPIVSTKVGGIENVVHNQVSALLSEPDDLEGFVTHLLSLVNSKQKSVEMGINGWAFVKDKYHFTRLVNDTAALYNRLLV